MSLHDRKTGPSHPRTSAAARSTLWDMHYLDDIRHDPWGTAMGHAGALCDVLAVAGEWEAIPASLGYSPGACGPHVEPGDAWAEWYASDLADGSLTVDAAERALCVLSRYLDVVRAAGRDY